MARITVGVPVYNQNVSYFRECLESIKNQTYRNFECLILDDGSTNKEEVEAIVKEYAARGYAFRYVYQKNGGIGAARQAIVDNASKETEFICFLASDDVWMPNFLEVMMKIAEQQPGKILYSAYYFVNENGQIVNKFDPPAFKDREDFCIACWSDAERNTMFVNVSTTFFPKQVFGKVQFDKSLRYCEDLDFLLRSMKHFKYYLVNQILLKYRITGMTCHIRDKIPKQNKIIRKKCREYWECQK